VRNGVHTLLAIDRTAWRCQFLDPAESSAAIRLTNFVFVAAAGVIGVLTKKPKKGSTARSLGAQRSPTTNKGLTA